MENRLLKQEIEHRLLLQEQLHQDQERLLALLGEGPTPWSSSMSKEGVLFASRALARLLGQEPEAMEGRCWTSGWPPAGKPVARHDRAAGRELDFLVAGQRDTLNARALPINLGAARLCADPWHRTAPGRQSHGCTGERPQEPLSPGHHRGWPVAGELSRLGGEFRSLADDLIRQQDDEPLRRALVDTMRLTLETWQQSTGKGKIVLAEKSKLWRVYMDRSSPQTRTLDKFLNLDTLPKAPRWKTVVASAEYVLRHCA